MPKSRKKPGSRSLQHRLFILCEGMKDKSESAYFKGFLKDCNFAGKKVEVRVIDTNKNTGKELVKEAKKCRIIPEDIIWVVYDKDGYTKHPVTFDTARSAKIEIAYSAVSFEYWILLHFEYTSKVFDKSEDVISHLKDKGYLDYTKGDKEIYSQTKSLIQTAMKNAKSIQKYQASGNPHLRQIYKFDPYTDIDKLITAIRKMEKIK